MLLALTLLRDRRSDSKKKMPISTRDIHEACNLIARQRHFEVCVTESLKGGAIAGISAVSLGLIFGPLGIAAGGALGGLLGAKLAKHYVPLAHILRDMSEEDKARFANHMMAVIKALDITDALMLITIVSNPQEEACFAIIRGMGNYFGMNWNPVEQ